MSFGDDAVQNSNASNDVELRKRIDNFSKVKLGTAVEVPEGTSRLLPNEALRNRRQNSRRKTIVFVIKIS
jgi:hypothetical protein